jgi:ATP-dependent protease ClpP protease subunit
MEHKIKISDSATRCVIDIEGVIGIPEESQFDSVGDRVATYERFREQVERIASIASPSVVVNIRSSGGDVNDALLIYDALASLDAHITTRCYGYTASAATIIAQAASEGCREMASSALYLVHRSSCASEGNADELSERVELLRKTDKRIASVYASRSGRSIEEFEALMALNNGNGRWLSPEEALEAGLIDTIVESGRQKPLRNALQAVARWFGFEPKGNERERGEMPSDRNVLHTADPGHLSIIELTEGQNRTKATEVKAVEDPAFDNDSLPANLSAYNRDALNMRLGR